MRKTAGKKAQKNPVSRLGAGYRINEASTGSPSAIHRQSFSGISMKHDEPRDWCWIYGPSRLTAAKIRLDAESQRLLELLLGGHKVPLIASGQGVSDGALACDLPSLLAEVRHFVGRMPEDSLEST